jgi:Peptidase family M1 domain
LRKVVIFIAYCFPLFSYSQRNYWQQQVDYTIDISLNDIENTLTGFEKIIYTNNSPDTLQYIWFHLWPNAYKNDRTAFSEQSLQNGKTNFYFSDKDERGYINHLDFRINGAQARTEDHPLYIDIEKVILPHPLPPGNQVAIETPFHVKLPINYSRGGHTGQSYQVTQWYPKPAVYDAKGWHEMPYLDQGEFFSEFGDFNVRITVPKNYVVAATGELQNQEEKEWLMTKTDQTTKSQTNILKPPPANKKNTSLVSKHPLPVKKRQINKSSSKETKTLVFSQNNVHDFAWFADKNYVVAHDTLLLESGKIIDCYSYYLPDEKSPWKKSIGFIKNAIRFHSVLIGEYPFKTVSAVEAKLAFDGGMEYPTITCISTMEDEGQLELTINHEVGHNWFYGILATNERRYPWMDEGINSYYDKRYVEWKQKANSGVPAKSKNIDWIEKKNPVSGEDLLIATLEKEKLDQPISTTSEDFTFINYNLIAYEKTALWMQELEKTLGRELFDVCMKEYYQDWQFKHPYPEDFESVIENTSKKGLSVQFAMLDKMGPLTPFDEHRKIKPTFLFNLRNTDKFSYVNLKPAAGFNIYDKSMLGIAIDNLDLPLNTFQFLLIPLYATASKQINGIGNLRYTIHPDDGFQNITMGVNGSRFSTLSGIDSNNKKIFGGLYKISPSVRLTFKNERPRSTIDKWAEFKTYVIGEKAFNYVRKSTDSNYYPLLQGYSVRYLNQLTFTIEDYRVLYPYSVQWQLQQGSEWYKLNFTSNYFFNYSKGGGMDIRFFAAKFGYIGGKTPYKQFETEVYQPKLTATRGYEDYTYSNYFIGRDESTGLASQQIMMKDGGLKLRTDLFANLQGRSDNWITAMNFNTSLPASIIPKQIPLKLFFDIGTYADAWGNDPPTSKFLYVGGVQLSLIRNLVNIYVPLFYSNDFKTNLKSVPEENTFWKKISFSIDIQNFNIKKVIANTPS